MARTLAEKDLIRIDGQSSPPASRQDQPRIEIPQIAAVVKIKVPEVHAQDVSKTNPDTSEPENMCFSKQVKSARMGGEPEKSSAYHTWQSFFKQGQPLPNPAPFDGLIINSSEVFPSVQPK